MAHLETFVARRILSVRYFLGMCLSALFGWIIGSHPPDHRATLALDHLNRVDLTTLVLPIARRFKAWRERALTHLGYLGHGFEATRLTC